MSNLVKNIATLFHDRGVTPYIEYTMETHMQVSANDTIKTQMQKGRDKGYHSWWHNKRCKKADLHQSLQNAVDRCDYSTAMIFAAMLEFRAKHDLEAPILTGYEGLGESELRLERLRVRLHSQIPSFLQDVYEPYALSGDSLIEDDMPMDGGTTTFGDVITTLLIQNKLIAKPYHIVYEKSTFFYEAITNSQNWNVIPVDDVVVIPEECLFVNKRGLGTELRDSALPEVATAIFQKTTDGSDVLQGGHGLPDFLYRMAEEARVNGRYLTYKPLSYSLRQIQDAASWELTPRRSNLTNNIFKPQFEVPLCQAVLL